MPADELFLAAAAKLGGAEVWEGETTKEEDGKPQPFVSKGESELAKKGAESEDAVG